MASNTSSSSTKPSLDTVWQWLADVPDPEIPVISVIDLGIVRELEWDDATLVVTVTPTYTGCPATRVINDDIRTHLTACGIDSIRFERRLSPAWTTDWLTEEGRDKLKEYGIAPPSKTPSTLANGFITVAAAVSCPRCQSFNTEMVSQFGSTPCKSSYRCLDCLEPFDYFKCI